VVIQGDLVRAPQSKPTPSTESSSETKPASTQETTSIHLGRYVFVSPHCTLHPPSRLTTSTSTSTSSHDTQTKSPTLTYYPLRIGDHVYIGAHTHIQAAQIGSHVRIGANCVIGNLVIVKDNVRIEDGAVLPANTVWGSGVVVAGRPARVVGEVGDGWAAIETGPGGAGEGRARWEGVRTK
jgi:dynactin 5